MAEKSRAEKAKETRAKNKAAKAIGERVSQQSALGSVEAPFTPSYEFKPESEKMSPLRGREASKLRSAYTRKQNEYQTRYEEGKAEREAAAQRRAEREAAGPQPGPPAPKPKPSYGTKSYYPHSPLRNAGVNIEAQKRATAESYWSSRGGESPTPLPTQYSVVTESGPVPIRPRVNVQQLSSAATATPEEARVPQMVFPKLTRVSSGHAAGVKLKGQLRAMQETAMVTRGEGPSPKFDAGQMTGPRRREVADLERELTLAQHPDPAVRALTNLSQRSAATIESGISRFPEMLGEATTAMYLEGTGSEEGLNREAGLTGVARSINRASSTAAQYRSALRKSEAGKGGVTLDEQKAALGQATPRGARALGQGEYAPIGTVSEHVIEELKGGAPRQVGAMRAEMQDTARRRVADDFMKVPRKGAGGGGEQEGRSVVRTPDAFGGEIRVPHADARRVQMSRSVRLPGRESKTTLLPGSETVTRPMTEEQKARITTESLNALNTGKAQRLKAAGGTVKMPAPARDVAGRRHDPIGDPSVTVQPTGLRDVVGEQRRVNPNQFRNEPAPLMHEQATPAGVNPGSLADPKGALYERRNALSQEIDRLNRNIPDKKENPKAHAAWVTRKSDVTRLHSEIDSRINEGYTVDEETGQSGLF